MELRNDQSGECNVHFSHTLDKVGRYCQKARFTFITITLDTEDKYESHRNAIIYDAKTGVAEYFEPNGIYVSECFPLVVRAIRETFTEHVPGFKELLLPIEPDEGGLQTTQVSNNKGCEPGSCVAWSSMYPDIRLMYPDVPRDVLLRRWYHALQLDRSFLARIISPFQRLISMIEAEFAKIYDPENVAQSLRRGQTMARKMVKKHVLIDQVWRTPHFEEIEEQRVRI